VHTHYPAVSINKVINVLNKHRCSQVVTPVLKELLQYVQDEKTFNDMLSHWFMLENSIH